MDISDVRGRIPYEITESLTARGISSFTEPQELAIKKGLFDGKNIVVAAPTASGKTLVAEIGCANTIIGRRRKAIYIAPMRALVAEKYAEFTASYPFIRTAISTGDLDSGDQWLSIYEMVFVSTEKLDSLIRHNAGWVNEVGCMVFDEIHMLGNQSRGATLELLITKLKGIAGAQMIALSATVGNAGEIARWMDAELVESDYRPVKLRKGVVYGNKMHYDSDDGMQAKKARCLIERLDSESGLSEVSIVEDTLKRGKQALIFYSSRKNAEAGAVRLEPYTLGALAPEERDGLAKLSSSIFGVLNPPTEQCRKLSDAIKSGIAFHHAGLMNQQRALIESAFKGNLIKVICSTTTLGLGINIPAHTVLVKDVHRYDGYGSSAIGANEVIQLFGRAGRPKYDKEGRALLIASSKESMELLFKRYIRAKPEPIDSSIGIAPVLRTHILAFVAEGFLNTKQAIDAFLARTFYGYQYRNMSDIKERAGYMLKELAEWNFIYEESGVFLGTRLGERVSQLYIDPLSARQMILSLNEGRDLLGNLFMLCNTLEMRPYLKVSEEAAAGYALMGRRAGMPPSCGAEPYDTYDPEGAYSTAMMLRDWMEEVREDKLTSKYSTTPGFIYNKLSNAEWMAYSAIELAKILHTSTHDLINMNARLKYGIKEELLDLVRLRGIGRVRARQLYNRGIKTAKDIKERKDTVIAALGKEVAMSVFEQLV